MQTAQGVEVPHSGVGLSGEGQDRLMVRNPPTAATGYWPPPCPTLSHPLRGNSVEGA